MTKAIKQNNYEFPEILAIIEDGRSRAFQIINVALIETVGG